MRHNRSPKSNRSPFQRTRLQIQNLESRWVPYSVTGNDWLHPELVTISFVPDGTVVGVNGSGQNIGSNLQATFNSSLGAGWKNEILKAAQVWAQQTNVNFSETSDNGTALGGGSYQQGDSGFGDIRVGGYNFGNGNLAFAYYPNPASNYSISGDILFNTGVSFNIGSTFDLFTVSAHEVGHALGLGHGAAGSVMQSSYPGTLTGLQNDDKNGIRAIYSGARTDDSYDGGNGNDTFATASNVTVGSANKYGQVPNADITTTGDVDYYKFVAPSGHNGTMQVTVQSEGLSLLHPKVYVYDLWQNQIGYATGYGNYGATVTLTVTSGIVAGRPYYVKVMGADFSAFGTGTYGLTANFGNNTPPAIPIPNTATLEGTPNVGGGASQSAFDVFNPLGDHDHDHAQDPGVATTGRSVIVVRVDPARSQSLAVSPPTFPQRTTRERDAIFSELASARPESWRRYYETSGVSDAVDEVPSEEGDAPTDE